MINKLQWGILGPGSIAHNFARQMPSSTYGTLLGVGSRSQERAERFGDEFNIPRRYGSYEDLLSDADIQAVYIATPHPMHAKWVMMAAEAGKHILCEKPITLNFAQAMTVFESAHENGVTLREAYMYRTHLQTKKLLEILQDGLIGEMLIIHADFSFRAGFNPESRIYNIALGGGGILDVGGYCTSMAGLIAGSQRNETYLEPTQIYGTGLIGESGVDEVALACLQYPGGVTARLATGIRLNLENKVKVYGTKGFITVESPWFCAPPEGKANILLERYGQEPQRFNIPSEIGVYALEADNFARTIFENEPGLAVTAQDTLMNLRTMDRWREAIGMRYDGETLESQSPPINERTLKKRKTASMIYGSIPGVNKPVSRFIMGTMLEGAVQPAPQAFALFDHFYEQGGNAFDTAHIYAGGISEKALGEWIKQRGIRADIALIVKGAHTPYCTPEDMIRQFEESLNRLHTDYADLYLLHRDNLDIPVGEFVGALNELKNAGRINAFGGSNWSLERVDAANAYAQEHGMTGFSAVSNNFSLARMVDPIWGGCISSSDAKSREWFTRTQIPLLSWSSQARGFFVRGNPEDTSDSELTRVWYSEDNFIRVQRARVLAEEMGVSPINIAAAYALCQPFPVFALIGPRMLSETRTSLPALSITLSTKQLKWLNLDE